MVENVLSLNQRFVDGAFQDFADITPPALLSFEWMRLIAPVVHLVPGRWESEPHEIKR